PRLKGANRGVMLEEGIHALRRLFAEREASFEGRYLRFGAIELAPKPHQRPFPIYLNAHGSAGLKRVGEIADGWIVAAMAPDQIPPARAEINAAANAAGRDPAAISLNFQIWLSFGRDQAEAEAKLKRSQHFRRSVVRRPENTPEGELAKYRAGNLLGNPED